MESAHAHGGRDRIHVRRVLRSFDQPAGLRNVLGATGGQGTLVRATALAGTKARGFGIGRRGVKAHVLAARETGGAGRTAVHARGAHGVVEDAVGAGVTMHDRGPSVFIASEAGHRGHGRRDVSIPWGLPRFSHVHRFHGGTLERRQRPKHSVCCSRSGNFENGSTGPPQGQVDSLPAHHRMVTVLERSDAVEGEP